MTTNKLATPRKRRSDRPFTRLLAQYRARVYETYFLPDNTPKNFMSGLTDSSGSGPTPLILVIEDNTDHWFLIRWALLQRFAKAHIHWLTQASEVMPYLESCRQKKVDIPRMILVDLYLPSAQQGLRVLQMLKSHPIYRPIPTLAISYSNRLDDITQVFNHSADGYLIKPTGYQDWIAGFSLLDKYWHREP